MADGLAYVHFLSCCCCRRGEIGPVARAALERAGGIPSEFGAESRKQIDLLLRQLWKQQGPGVGSRWGEQAEAEVGQGGAEAEAAAARGEEEGRKGQARRRVKQEDGEEEEEEGGGGVRGRRVAKGREGVLKALEELKEEVDGKRRRSKTKTFGGGDWAEGGEEDGEEGGARGGKARGGRRWRGDSSGDDGDAAVNEDEEDGSADEGEEGGYGRRVGSGGGGGPRSPVAGGKSTVTVAVRKYDYCGLPALSTKERFLTEYQKWHGNRGEVGVGLF